MKRPYEIHLLNWQLSVFWAFTGILSVATCVSHTNRRLKAEEERVQLQRDKLDLLERISRLQQQAKQQEQQLLQVDDLLTHSTTNWFGRQQLPYRDLLAVLTGSKTVTSG